jgi:hypothetical protein
VHSAVPVLGLHMLYPRLVEFEKAITFPAIMVFATFNEVLSPRVEASKVDPTFSTNPVGIGILFVLFQNSVVWERLIAANTIRHWVVVVRNEERSQPWGIDFELI